MFDNMKEQKQKEYLFQCLYMGNLKRTEYNFYVESNFLLRFSLFINHNRWVRIEVSILGFK